ncbi:N-acetylmuramoyl-L-alanine amidase [Streptomyces sp. NPDC088725]|uniref:N-acetylmuramoyl-L-alanine amidase n=1 Tax=Streptomyces sp. NPDC088725 TaxID=3365873 RepID=UPI003804282A
MRAFLATSIGAACSVALVLPLSLPSDADAAPSPAGRSDRGDGAVRDDRAPAPGSTQSLPLAAAPEGRTIGRVTGRGRARGTERGSEPATEPGPEERDLTGRGVRPFSLLGLVWDDPAAELRGTVRVRTRATGSETWSGWQSLETHNEDHGADLGAQEREESPAHGSTAPLWVGDSDGVEVRVRGATGGGRALPSGMRLDLVDPGDAPDAEPDAEPEAEPAAVPDTEPDAEPDPAAEPPATTRSGVAPRALRETAADNTPAAKPYTGRRPRIISRKGWGADEKLREKKFGYTKAVKVVFVHHSATGNNYTCKQAPSVLRGIYRFHVKSNGWRDLGYNFAIDKCGNIYEGRAGGVAKAVMGAHTLGFNSNSMGIAVLGTYKNTNPSAAATTAIAKLSAWKLGLYEVDPRAKVVTTSQGGDKYRKGKKVKLDAISGHRDGFATDCPGDRLYNKLRTVRTSATKYQGGRL